MLREARVAAASFVLVAFALLMEGSPDANADGKLPDPIKAGVAEKLFRLDCGRSVANDESVWTPGENVGRRIEFSSTCWLIRHGSEWLLWDTGVPETAHNDPKGWSTIPTLIVYHLDKTLTDQLVEIGLKPSDISRVAISHTHGDHIGNMGLFPEATVLMQQAEYSWINSDNGPNDNVNQLMALARKLLGTPKNLQLINGDTDVFGDESVTLISTPGHTPGSQSLLVHLKNSEANSCFLRLSFADCSSNPDQLSLPLQALFTAHVTGANSQSFGCCVYPTTLEFSQTAAGIQWR